MLKNKKILVVMSHPDDEVVFGWPILFDETIEKEVLICSDDRNNPERSNQKRKEALESVLSVLNIKGKSLHYDSEFYRLPSRNGTLSGFVADVIREVEEKELDAVFTHNSYGEYGHLDHQLIHTILARKGLDIYTTDIFIESNWMPFQNIHLNGEEIAERELDEDLYIQCEDIYKKHNAWTWDKPPVKRARVLKL